MPINKKEAYIETTISANIDELVTYKPLSVEESSNYINFLLTKIEEEPINDVKYRTKTIPVRVYRQFEAKLKTIKEELKQRNVSFSEFYKKYYFDFLKSIHKVPK